MGSNRVKKRTEASLLEFMSMSKDAAQAGRTALCAIVAGGKAAMEGSARTMIELTLVEAFGGNVARHVMKGGPKVAGPLAPVLSAVEFAFDQRETMLLRHRGELDESEFQCETGGNVGNAVGGLGGSLGGAALGTAICPGVGTIAGAIMGGTGGGYAGRKLGKTIVDVFRRLT